MDLPLDHPPGHPNGDRQCLSCGRMVFWLYPKAKAEDRTLCALCVGIDSPAGPIEWTGIIGGGEYRLRQTPWTGKGMAPTYEYRQSPDFVYPEVLKETEIDEVSIVRTCAMPEMNKYGNSYETVYINNARRMKKQLGVHPNRAKATEVHDTFVNYVNYQKSAK